MSIQTYVSNERETGLTPLFTMAAGMLTGDRSWRRAFVEQIAARPHDVIFDIGCGDGAMDMMLAEAARGVTIVGIDPDETALTKARARAATASARISFAAGLGRDLEQMIRRTAPTKVISSLVLHKVSLAEKREILDAARAALAKGGTLHIADYGAQRTALMQRLFRGVQRLEGFENTEANARGALPGLIRAAGFEAVEETHAIATVSGSISLYRARAA
jgi:ubiquinone/menaquinone biosynthesis C-methylase UbiE